MATWHTEESARDAWADAPLNTDTLEELLEIGQEAVLAYAPARVLTIEDGREIIPASWRRVQLEHARNVYRAMYTDQGGVDEMGSFGAPVRYRNLDASLREMLRPRTIFGGPVR